MDRDLLRRIYQWSAVLSGRPSSPGELHPEALTEPCLSLSTHTARVIHEELPPFATIRRFLLLPVDQRDQGANDLPPSLHGHYSASSLIQGSPPLNSASVLSPSWGLPTCGFSVSIKVQVPTFHLTASWQAQATSHAGCRSARKQVSSELVPQQQ